MKANATIKQKNRGPIKSSVLRQLYLLSGNTCAFTKCGQVLIDAAGDFVGEVCHIEAAEPGGQRYNPASTNEERRGARNLILICTKSSQEK